MCGILFFVDNPRSLKNIKVNNLVTIKTINGNAIEGKVKSILTKCSYHMDGIKVQIDDDSIGRVQKIHSPFSEREILKQLESEFFSNLSFDESENLEFKATFRFDLARFERAEEKYPFDIGPHSIAKTIAAFANNKGGILYIGVNDSPRKILGLKHDYDLLNEERNKEFLFHLKRHMDKLLTAHDFRVCVADKRILHLNEEDVCMIKVTPSKVPIIVLYNQKQEFYVRFGDHSVLYENIQEFCNHWCKHMCMFNS